MKYTRSDRPTRATSGCRATHAYDVSTHNPARNVSLTAPPPSAC